ncbi:A-kinase anchor protein 1, mitochondrial [Tiliqua scincoides]|uniref:A-kinase anchor protein 1, mitochondrial n=1 Tax=Tiliqua scincoides TaxID=71010 RepID=UPI0034633F20
MALRFRTLLPFTIPGVLALIGWWWFSAQKKARISNHDRRDVASLEERGIGSPEKEPCSGEEAQLNSKLSLPLEAKQFAEPTIACKPSSVLRASSPDRGAWSLDSSEDPVAVQCAIESSTIQCQDNSEKLEIVVSQGVCRPPAHVASLLDGQTAGDSRTTEGITEGKWDATHLADQKLSLASVMASTLTSPCLEKLGDSGDVAIQDESSEKVLREGRCHSATSLDAGSLSVPCFDVASETIPKTLSDADETRREEVNGGVASEVESEAGMLSDKITEPASSELSPEEEVPSSDHGDMLVTCHRIGDVGYKNSLENERTVGVTLDREVETIEQVAIHLISRVILAATEEVLSGSVSDVSGRIGQVAGSQVDKPLEKTSVGTGGQVESSKGSECIVEKTATVDPAPLQEENTSRHTMYSSHLTHGLLANPSCGQPRDSIPAKRPGGDLTVVSNLEEAFEDSHIVAEDSGCSASTSEDGASAEDLLKNASPPALGQCRDLLTMSIDKDSEHRLAPSEQPPSPSLPENKVPYSNGVLKEDCPDLRHDQQWQAEADGDHSGGSDVNSMDSVDSGCALRKSDSCQNSKMGTESSKIELVIWEIEIPKHLVGRLIGKQGRYVSFLKQASGAKIYISTLPYTQDFQICHIEGSQQNVDKALSLIGKKFKDLSLTNIYAPPPPPLPLHSLPITSWLLLPDGVTVEVIVVNQVNAGHLFVQQHTHPTFHALRSLDQQMYLCYSQPGIPTLPTPVEVGVVCAAPGMEGAWWRAQVIGYFKDTSEVEIRYVDYGGYERVKIDTIRQIRSDFVTLPFQGAEVLLDNIVPLPDEDHFSPEADTAVGEMTRGAPLLAQVTSYDSATGLPLIQLWSMIGDELVSINRTLVERGFAQWVESY